MKPVFYTCVKYPGLGIGNPDGPAIKFRRGHFKATDKTQKNAIEKNEWFNVFISKLDEPPTYEKPLVPEPSHAIQKKIADGTSNVQVVKTNEETEEETESSDSEEGEIIVSQSAFEVLEAKGLSVDKATAILDLSPGDRLTVKMAQELPEED